MAEAEDLFSEIYKRFLKNWSVIDSLRQFVEIQRQIAEVALAELHLNVVDRMMTDPAYKGIFVNVDGSDKPMDEDTKRVLQTAMTDLTITNAQTAIDAACLVFAHSVLDDCALSYCKVCALAAPKDWEIFIDSKTIKFEALREANFDVLRQQLIDAKLLEIERKSLLTKVDLLFRLCQPPTGFDPIGNYAFDRGRLEQIDEARHRVIHGDAFGNSFTNVETDLTYISKTANYLMALVNQKYGLRLDMRFLFGLKVVPSE